VHRSIAAGIAGLCLLSASARAQSHENWVQVYGASATGIDETFGVVAAPSGWICAVGGTGDKEAFVLRYDASGSLAWSRTFALTANGTDLMYEAVIEPATENVYAVGRGHDGSTRGVILKYDSQGNLLWSRSYGAGATPIVFYRAHLEPNGNLLVAGTRPNSLVVAEYDPQGTLLWDGVVPGGEYPTALATDVSGNIVLTGPFDLDPAAQTYRFGVAKLSPAGALLWSRSPAGGAGMSAAAGLAIDALGSIYAGGRFFDASGHVQAALLKFDPQGNVLWTRTHQGTAPSVDSSDESWRSVMFAPDGNVRVAGLTTNVGSASDVHVAEFTPAGQLVWEDTWDSPNHGSDNALLAVTELDGSMAVLARTLSAGLYAPVVLRWNSDGSLRWSTIDTGLTAWPSISVAGIGPDGLRLFGGRTAHSATGYSDALLVVAQEQGRPYGFGDGSSGACPCGNNSPAGFGQGCANSAGAGASLFDTGDALLAADSLVLTSHGLLASTLSTLLQGDAQASGVPFGDGLRAIGGNLRRLFVTSAQAGSISLPSIGDPSISARSAALGNPISAGARRFYQVHYRDPDTAFCTVPSGSTFNVSSAIGITWRP
jgi:hypothetical protein